MVGEPVKCVNTSRPEPGEDDECAPIEEMEAHFIGLDYLSAVPPESP